MVHDHHDTHTGHTHRVHIMICAVDENKERGSFDSVELTLVNTAFICRVRSVEITSGNAKSINNWGDSHVWVKRVRALEDIVQQIADKEALHHVQVSR